MNSIDNGLTHLFLGHTSIKSLDRGWSRMSAHPWSFDTDGCTRVEL